MKLLENWAAVLWKSLSLWCVYIALIAAGLHQYIGATDNGVVPDAWVAGLDGWLKAISFIFGLLAIPARIIQQPAIAPK